MLLDKETLFSDCQKVTAAAASENVIHTAAGHFKEIAFGQPIPLLIQVVEDFVNATKVQVDVQTASDEAFTTPTTLASATLNAADLKAGSKFPINFVPKGNLGYMRLYYTPSADTSKTITAGAITAGIVAAHDNSYHDM